MASAAPVYVEDAPDIVPGPLAVLAQIASAEGDISFLLDDSRLAAIGANVVEDYERDDGDRSEWREQAEEGLKRASQEKIELAATAAPYRFSSVNFPILTIAAQQFNARAYPAICKSGNLVKVAVIGSDKGRPQMIQTPQGIVPAPVIGPDGQPVMGPDGKPQIQWAVPPGAKAARAGRVSDYLNAYLEYRLEDWEADTDALLMQLPVIGCGFRKVWWTASKQKSAFVSAMNLVVPQKARSLKTTPRITEEMPDVYPYQIRERMASGEYRQVTLAPTEEDDEAPRLLLEQHRLFDLDGDGVDEPYIVTVDKETSQVLRIIANFGVDDIHLSDDSTRVLRIERQHFYVKYSFLPDPKGGFYDLGFGHLLGQMSDIINTTLNQMFDAGHAQIAGGGFIASGLRLQGNGQTSALTWMPGEYKTINATGADIRAGIIERTFPNVSPIMFQLLELMLGAAKDITSVKDVVTGEASNQGQVGTTLALIEQGLAVFTAIYKRVYRALGDEFQIYYENLGSFGGEAVTADYTMVLDDPLANFEADFSEKDMDIRPVADPSSVTKMQRAAKAQALLSFRGQGGNDLEINRRALEALDIEGVDDIFPSNPQPNPAAVAELENKQADTELKKAQAASYTAQANQKAAEATNKAVDTGLKLGEAEYEHSGSGNLGGLAALAQPPSDPMGVPGAPDDGAPVPGLGAPAQPAGLVPA